MADIPEFKVPVDNLSPAELSLAFSCQNCFAKPECVSKNIQLLAQPLISQTLQLSCYLELAHFTDFVYRSYYVYLVLISRHCEIFPQTSLKHSDPSVLLGQHRR